jgi:hypothetical protein
MRGAIPALSPISLHGVVFSQAEFLGGFSRIFFFIGRVVIPTTNPHPGGPGLCIYIPQKQGNYPF